MAASQLYLRVYENFDLPALLSPPQKFLAEVKHLLIFPLSQRLKLQDLLDPYLPLNFDQGSPAPLRYNPTALYWRRMGFGHFEGFSETLNAQLADSLCLASECLLNARDLMCLPFEIGATRILEQRANSQNTFECSRHVISWPRVL